MHIAGKQTGFSLVEALVALTLFTVFFAGGITLLTVFEAENRETEIIRIAQDQGYVFLIDWANYARQFDVINASGKRPSDSVLDVFKTSDGIDFMDVSDLSFADQRTANKIRDWQTTLANVKGMTIDTWVLTTTTSDDAYRTITLVINNERELSWHVCCGD